VEPTMLALGDTSAWLLRCVSIILAVLLVVGLGTPIAALAVAAIQVGVILSSHPFNAFSLVAGALALGLSMLGPGAWSVDAWLFGRKRIV
jgi:putative oxidoreductase